MQQHSVTSRSRKAGCSNHLRLSAFICGLISCTILGAANMKEVVLAPEAYLRLSNNAKLDHDADGRARISKGEALLEVDKVPTARPISIATNNVLTTIRQRGLYDFNPKHGTIAVYVGAADLQRQDRRIHLISGQGAKTRTLHEFPATPDPSSRLYVWSDLRSQELSLDRAASMPTHNTIPEHRGGDLFLYGPPVRQLPSAGIPSPPAYSPPPAVPLTAPGVPSFPNSRGPGRP